MQSKRRDRNPISFLVLTMDYYSCLKASVINLLNYVHTKHRDCLRSGVKLGSGDGVRGCRGRGSPSPPYQSACSVRDQQVGARGAWGAEGRQEEETDSLQTQEAPSVSRWKNHVLTAVSSTRGLGLNPCGNK